MMTLIYLQPVVNPHPPATETWSNPYGPPHSGRSKRYTKLAEMPKCYSNNGKAGFSVCAAAQHITLGRWLFFPRRSWRDEFLCITPFLFSLQVVFCIACTSFSAAIMWNLSIHFLFWWLRPSDIICHLTSTSPTSAAISISEEKKSFPSSLLPICSIKCEEPIITPAYL